MDKQLKLLLKTLYEQQIDWNDVLGLSEDCIRELNQEAIPIISPEGSFYAVGLPKRFKAVLIVVFSENENCWMISNLKVDKQGWPRSMSLQKQLRIIQWLLRNSILVRLDEEPFLEYREQIQPLGDRAFFVSYDNFEDLQKKLNQTPFQVDDSLEGLEDFMEDKIDEN